MKFLNQTYLICINGAKFLYSYACLSRENLPKTTNIEFNIFSSVYGTEKFDKFLSVTKNLAEIKKEFDPEKLNELDVELDELKADVAEINDIFGGGFADVNMDL